MTKEAEDEPTVALYADVETPEKNESELQAELIETLLGISRTTLKDEVLRFSSAPGDLLPDTVLTHGLKIKAPM